jgi:hypothetical protein
MIIKIRKGVIYACDNGYEEPIGSIFDSASEEHERTLECAAEALPVVRKFIDDVNSGSFKPRAAVKEFEKVLEKYAV